MKGENMKRISHTFRARDRLLHIETELGIINIYTGLHDHKGSVMERIEIIPDDYAGEPEVRMEGSRTVILKQRREFNEEVDHSSNTTFGSTDCNEYSLWGNGT